MKRDLTYTELLVAVMFVLLPTLIFAARPELKSDSRQRKADYIFLEALRHRASEKNDAYFELAEAAYQTNPADKYLAMEHATRKLLLQSADHFNYSPDSVKLWLATIMDYVSENPSDLSAISFLSRIASHFGDYPTAAEAWRLAAENDSNRTEITLKYIDALIALRDTTSQNKSLRLLDNIEAAEGINPDLAMRRMTIYDLRHDTLAIKNEGKRMLASSPNSIPYLSFMGKLYMQLNDTDSALIFFNRAVEADPDNGQAILDRATFYNLSGDSTAYDSEVFRAISLPDLDVNLKIEILKGYVSKLYQDSIQLPRIDLAFNKIVTLHPHNAEVRQLYADYLAVTNKFTEAAEQRNYQLDLKPDDEKGWVNLASIYLHVNDFKNTEKAALRGNHYFPNNIQLYELASIAATQSGDYSKARNYIETALELVDSTDVEEISSLNSQIGDIFYKLGDIDSTRIYYDKAVLYNNQNLLALNNYAYYLACNELDLDKALDYIERVMAQKNDDPTSLDTYAWVLFKLKNYDKAREIIDKTIELSDEPSSELYEHAGDIYFMDAKPDQAVVFWQKALKLDPNNTLLKRKVKHKTFFYK